MLSVAGCDLWFKPLATPSAPRVRLCCFAFAGGSAAAFTAWAAALPAWVELRALQLPGRAERLREPPQASLAALLPLLQQAIAPLDDLPLVFFGHSNGALIAFELARTLRRAAGAQHLRHLVLSSKPAPHLRRKMRHQLSDAELLEELQRFGGTPPELLQHREFMLAMLPMIRADFALAETHHCVAAEPLDVPAALWWGRDDATVAPDDVQQWQRYLAQPASLQEFPGGHFYLQRHQGAVLCRLLDILQACCRGPSPALASAAP